MEYVNFALFGIFSFYIWKKYQRINLAIFYSSIWTFSALIGTVYYNSDSYREGLYGISLLPFIVLFSLFFILLLPLSRNEEEIEIVDGNIKWLSLFMAYIGIISVYPFIETSIDFAKSIVDGRFMLLGSMYEDIVSGRAESFIKYSKLGGFLYVHSYYWSNLSLVLAFFYYGQRNHNRLILIGLLMNSLLPVTRSLAIGNRTMLMWYLIFIISLYLLYRNYFSLQSKKNVKKTMTITFCIAIAIISSLSISRYIIGKNMTNEETSSAIYQYTAESMYNFNEFLFHDTGRLNGVWTFNPLLHNIGLSDVGLDDLSRREYVEQHLSSPSFIFYTGFGEFWGDFGPIGAYIITILISIIFSNFMPKRIMKLEDIALLSIYLYFVGNSLFYFCYKTSFANIYAPLAFYIAAKLSRGKTNQIKTL